MFRNRNPYPSQQKTQQRRIPINYSPKVQAKRHQIMPLAKKIVPGHSAHNPHRRRFQQVGKVQYLSRQKPRILLSQQQVRNSATYKMLEQQILKLASRQQSQVAKLKLVRRQKQQQLAQLKKQKQGIKFQIWELKNEAMELKQSIKQQQQENQRLQEEFDGQNTSNNSSSIHPTNNLLNQVQ